MDALLSAAATALLSPVLLITAVLIRADDGGPVIYRQTRIGRDRKPFVILKFRSMPTSTQVAPSATMGTASVTRVGRFIRRLNVDELPQLINILRGDMAIVGPRPALADQAALIDMRAAGGAMRLRPGLTGLAQVGSYDGMPDTAKAALDNQYAERVTLLQDITIIARTVGYLLKPPPTY